MTDRQYSLGQMFKIWVDQVRGPTDIAVLVSTDSAEADKFVKICADLTGLDIGPAGNLCLHGRPVAYVTIGTEELYRVYVDAAVARRQITLTIGIDPDLDFFHVGTVDDDDNVDSDGLYYAVPESEQKCCGQDKCDA